MSEFLLKTIELLNNEKIDKLFEINAQSSITFHKTIKKGKNEIRCDESKDPINETEYIIFINNENYDSDKPYKIKDELTKRYKGIQQKITKKSEFAECTIPFDITDNKKLEKPEKFPFTKTEKLIGYPNILRINFKIFNNDLEKVFMNTEIPNTWSYDNNKYKLTGICVHEGETMDTGHYMYYSLEDGKWIEYSDNDVKPYKDTSTGDKYYKLTNRPNGINIFNTDKDVPCPYLLYYQKIE
jgi:hypothetical protein